MEASDEDNDAYEVYEVDDGIEQSGEEDSDGDLEISDASDRISR